MQISATLIPQGGEALVHEFTGGDYNLFRSLVQLDGEDHKEHRRVLVQALGPSGVAALQTQMRATASAQLEVLEASGGELDFAHHISTP